MGHKLMGSDIATIIFGVIMLILTASLFGIMAVIVQNQMPMRSGLHSQLDLGQFGVAGWFLLTSVLAIASGATAHKGPYIATIVLSIFGVFVAAGGAVIAAFSCLTATIQNLELTMLSSVLYSSFPVAGTVTPPTPLPCGAMAINILGFVFMIVISCLSCCGVCSSAAGRIQAQPAVAPPPVYTNNAPPPMGYDPSPRRSYYPPQQKGDPGTVENYGKPVKSGPKDGHLLGKAVY